MLNKEKITNVSDSQVCLNRICCNLFYLSVSSFFAIKARWPQADKANNLKIMVPCPAMAARASPASRGLTDTERSMQSPFERMVYDMTHNERMGNDLLLERRVGFYELRGEIGQGNFSHVRLGIHALTHGEGNGLYFIQIVFFCCCRNSSIHPSIPSFRLLINSVHPSSQVHPSIYPEDLFSGLS